MHGVDPPSIVVLLNKPLYACIACQVILAAQVGRVLRHKLVLHASNCVAQKVASSGLQLLC